MRFHALCSNTVASARSHSHARMNCAWSETERLYMLSMRIMRETERTQRVSSIRQSMCHLT